MQISLNFAQSIKLFQYLLKSLASWITLSDYQLRTKDSQKNTSGAETKQYKTETCLYSRNSQTSLTWKSMNLTKLLIQWKKVIKNGNTK